jgi:ankyrin repeat protein
MKRIEGQVADSQVLARQALSWITCAKSPLTILELQHALAVEIGESELDKENLPEIENVISVCARLVVVDEKSDIIRLVLYTTQEYFERTWTFWFPDAQKDIATICVTYLSFDTFETGFCLTDEEFEAQLRLNILYDYAARNWGYHARAASIVGEKMILDLLKSEAKVSAANQAMLASRSGSWDSGYSQRVPRQVTGVHLAAYFGLREAMITLLKDGHDPDAKDGYDRTPLSRAAENGQEAVAKLLLATNAVDPDSKDRNGGTPLSWAAGRGHEAVVKLLLANDAVDPDSKNIFGGTPLSWAARSGHETVLQLLLASDGVNPDSKDQMGRTPLLVAAKRGHEAVVKRLLEMDGVDLDSKDEDGRTPLWWAAERGHDAVVKLLQSGHVLSS